MMTLTFYLLMFLLLWCAGIDPVLANKFETISGGVSGMSREKLDLLKNISLYLGGFLIFLALLALLTRNRFEGFVGYSGRDSFSAALKGATVLTVAGSVFIGLSFL